MFHDECMLATVLLVSSQFHTHSSSLARACHMVKLKVGESGQYNERGANHTPQEEECRILLQGGTELW